MLDKVKELIVEVEGFNATTKDEVESFRIKYLGSKGLLKGLFAEFKNDFMWFLYQNAAYSRKSYTTSPSKYFSDGSAFPGKTYTLVEDVNLKQGIEINEETGVVTVDGDNVTYRATYLIDEEGTVFHEGVNHMPVGRNVNEFLRLIDAYAHVQSHGEVCPANWEEGKDAMAPNAKGTAEYLSSH